MERSVVRSKSSRWYDSTQTHTSGVSAKERVRVCATICLIFVNNPLGYSSVNVNTTDATTGATALVKGLYTIVPMRMFTGTQKAPNSKLKKVPI
jgi:hypothetical protein